MKKLRKFPFFSILFCLLEILLLVLTFIRLPFFIRIIKRNFFTKKHHTIKFRKCVQIAFIELLKDIPFIFLSSVIVIVAPWRIKLLLQTISSQQRRVPSFEHASKKINVPGKRKDLLMVFWRVWSYDYVNILMGLILILSIYKLKKALFLLKISFRQLENDFHFRDFDLRKAFFQEILSLYENSKMILHLLVIMIIGFRVKVCYKRIKRLKRLKSEKHDIKQLRIKFDPNSKGIMSRAITYNTFSIIAQYLDLKDLASLSLVNRRFYNFVESERIWIDQFHFSWREKYIDDKLPRTYKEKCLKAFYDSRDKNKINEEKKDEILGYYHIIYEEFLESLFLIPHWILLPIKLLSFVCIKFDKLDNELHWNNMKYIPATILCDLYIELIHSLNFPIGEVDIMQLHSYLPFFLIKYFAKAVFCLSYFLMYPIFLIKKSLSAGNVRRIQLMVPNPELNQDSFKNQIDMDEDVQEISDKKKRVLFYFLQTLSFPFLVLYIAGTLLSPPLFYWLVLQGTWYQCLTGYYLTNVPLYISTLMILLTIYDLSEGFPFYQPIECILILLKFMNYLSKCEWEFATL